MTRLIPLRALAHGRAGDKGDTLTLSIIARTPADFEHLRLHVTTDLCKTVFADRSPDQITRYELPNLSALNFMIEGVLDGGVNRSLHVDRHGKTLSSLVLDTMIPAPDAAQ